MMCLSVGWNPSHVEISFKFGILERHTLYFSWVDGDGPRLRCVELRENVLDARPRFHGELAHMFRPLHCMRIGDFIRRYDNSKGMVIISLFLVSPFQLCYYINVIVISILLQAGVSFATPHGELFVSQVFKRFLS